MHTTLGRLYKTGDLGKWNKNGYIEFVGRADNQVKLNGYRVELEEISAKLSKIEGIEEAIVRIKKLEKTDYIIAYILPLGYETIKSEVLDKQAFRLEQKGLIHDLEPSYTLPIHCNIDYLKKRKSYRNFLTKSLDGDLINTIINDKIANITTPLEHDLQQLVYSDLLDLLLMLTAIHLEDKVLPKYSYPSAGSSYPVRCFVKIVDLENIKPGYYYYHPINKTLCSVSNLAISKETIYNELNLVIHWPAITPLYGKSSRNLAFIEVGHILNNLNAIFEYKSIGCKLQLLEEKIDDNNSIIARLIFTDIKFKLPDFDLSIRCVDKQPNGLYKDIENAGTFALNSSNPFQQLDENTRILQKSTKLITVKAKNTINNLICAGFLFQSIASELYKYNIGSCSLGLAPFRDCIYSMALGKVSDTELLKAESNVVDISLKDIINPILEKSLPEYMLPYDYVVLSQVPLTAQGKLDLKMLPSINIHSKAAYVPPRNELEIQICQIWKEILNLEDTQISIYDDFFKLGGNSLFSIKLLSRLNNTYMTNIKISDIFVNKNIMGQAKLINYKKTIYNAVIKLNNSL